MKKLLAATLSMGLPLFVTGVSEANAMEPGKGFYLAPVINYHVFDEELNLDDRHGWGLDVGYQFSPALALELDYFSVDTQDSDNHDDTNVEYSNLQVQYHFGEWSDRFMTPYVLAGIGETNYETSPLIDDDTQVNLGGGVKMLLSPHTQFKVGAEAVYGTGVDVVSHQLQIGLVYTFKPADMGRKPAPVVVMPAPAPVPPADTDKDGVVDASDACPDTKAGAKVDSKGCYIILKENKEFTLDVKFKTGSAELDASTKGSIQKLAEFLRSYPMTTVVIEGHTDSVGSAASNKTLSQKRADSVKNSLVKEYGTEASRVTSVGYGLERPIADNKTDASRAQNRRVVAKVQATVEKIQE